MSTKIYWLYSDLKLDSQASSRHPWTWLSSGGAGLIPTLHIINCSSIVVQMLFVLLEIFSDGCKTHIELPRMFWISSNFCVFNPGRPAIILQRTLAQKSPIGRGHIYRLSRSVKKRDTCVAVFVTVLKKDKRYLQSCCMEKIWRHYYWDRGHRRCRDHQYCHLTFP